MIQVFDSSAGVEIGTASIPALIVADGDRERLEMVGATGGRLLFYDRIDLLCQRLDDEVPALVIETRDADGFPVPAAIRPWVEQHPLVPIVVWTAGGAIALREILELSAAGGDVRLVLRRRDDLAEIVDRLFVQPSLSQRGAVPTLLRGVVLAAPEPIQPDLTLAVYQAWPRPSVQSWADSLHVTRQALNARLAAARYATASAIMDSFSAAEIAIRCTLGIKLRHIAAAMGRLDDRSLRRRLAGLGCRPEQLRDAADFRALIPRVLEAVRRRD